MIASCILASVFVSQVVAFPNLYDSEQDGCEIPDMTFGNHMTPEVDDTITVSLEDASGEPAEGFTPGATYSVVVPAYDGANEVHAWLHSTAGTWTALAGYTVAACEEAIYSTGTEAEHTVEWTAPAEADGCVTVSVAQAAGATDSYHTVTAEVCPAELDAAAGAATPAPAPDAAEEPPAEDDTPDIVGGDGSDDDAPADEDVDDAAADEGEAEGDEEDTDGARGAGAAVAAAVAVCAVAVAAALP